RGRDQSEGDQPVPRVYSLSLQAMKTRLAVLCACFGALCVSFTALAQNPPPPPPATPPIPIQGRGGVVGGVAGGVPGTAQPGRSSVPPAPLVTTGLIVGRVIDSATGKGVSGAVVTLNGGPSRAPMPAQPGQPSMPPPPPPQILTDNDGRYAFMNLTRGNYTLSVTKVGYAQGAFGRLRPNGPSKALQLDDNEKMGDATIRLFKYGSITGSLIDESGEPVVSMPVRAYRRVLIAGRRVLTQSGGSVSTDDRGIYRMGNLAPGEYVIVVPVTPVTVPAGTQGAGNRTNLQMTSQYISSGAPNIGGGGQAIGPDPRFVLQRFNGMSGEMMAAPDASGRILGFSTVYYPNARVAAGAEIVKIASGEERNGVDVMMRRVPTVSVSGSIMAPDGPAADYAIRLLPVDTGDIQQEPETAVAASDGTGGFMFIGVPTGQYVIQVTRFARPTPMVDAPRPVAVAGTPVALPALAALQQQPIVEPLLWASAQVSVGDTDIRGLQLTLREGLTISGRLDFSGTRPRPEPQRLTQVPINVESADGRQQFSPGAQSRVQADGRFTTVGQAPGKYFIRVGGVPGGWTVQAITVGGVDATDAPIDLTNANLANVVITFSDLVQDVRGAVSGLKPDTDPPGVVVFPADSTAWKNFGTNPMRMRMARAGTTGQYGVGALPPGDYFAIAIPDEYTGEWQDPAYLDLLSRTATRFTLSPGERRTLDLSLQDVKPPAIRVPAPSPVPQVPLVPEVPVGGPYVADDEDQQVRDSRAAAPVGAGSISGVVKLDDGSNTPARFARISVRASNLPGERTALTDNEGRYSVPGLAPGSYQVSVSKPAYLSMYFGAKRPNVAQGVPIRVDAGQAVTGIDMSLKKGGVVTGMVIGVDGEPAANVRVQLMRRLMTDGEIRLTGVGASGQPVTDDRGMFRFFGIAPGSYVVSAQPQNQGNQSEIRQLSDQEMRTAVAASAGKLPAGVGRVLAPALPGPLPETPPAGRPVSFAPVFYPGTTIEEQAGVFTVVAGQEVNISLAMQLVTAARIEGTVVTADGQLMQLNGGNVMLQRSSGSGINQSPVRMMEPGKFQAVGVPPGRYQLIARWAQPMQRSADGGPPISPMSNPQWYAQQDIEIA